MQAKLIHSIYRDPMMMEILKLVKELGLPDCWVGAGFVRNKTWDMLHDFSNKTILTDIDVVFFDEKFSSDPSYDEELQYRLKTFRNDIKWEVVNQARTHIWHKRLPYKDTTDAISEWVETATCIGIHLDKNDKLILTAPHGLDDLENLILRPVPSLKDITIFKDRIFRKKWLEKWPKLLVVPSSTNGP